MSAEASGYIVIECDKKEERVNVLITIFKELKTNYNDDPSLYNHDLDSIFKLNGDEVEIKDQEKLDKIFKNKKMMISFDGPWGHYSSVSEVIGLDYYDIIHDAGATDENGFFYKIALSAPNCKFTAEFEWFDGMSDGRENFIVTYKNKILASKDYYYSCEDLADYGMKKLPYKKFKKLFKVEYNPNNSYDEGYEAPDYHYIMYPLMSGDGFKNYFDKKNNRGYKRFKKFLKEDCNDMYRINVTPEEFYEIVDELSKIDFSYEKAIKPYIWKTTLKG